MSETPTSRERSILTAAYTGFNARDIDAVLALMAADVVWPNGMEGGYVHGHDGVRAYWTRQWALIDPHVEPLRFQTDADGWIVLDVHQVVRDLNGVTLIDQMVQHAYDVKAGLIRRMEIRAAPAPPSVTIRREDLSDSAAGDLIPKLNRELSGIYPEPGANHFGLTTADVAPGNGAFLVAYHAIGPSGAAPCA